MSDQLFWIISILLVVEILSQILQFDSMGKVFIQLYSLIVHGLVGLTLASFETIQLVYYFLVLITIVNGFRFVIYRVPAIQERYGLRFTLDFILISVLLVLMARIDPFLSFGNVPSFEANIKYLILAILVITLLYEMFQRAFRTGLHLNGFLPESFFTSLIVLGFIAIGIVIGFRLIDLSPQLYYLVSLGYLVLMMVVRVIASSQSRNPEYYDLLYVLPTIFTMALFIQLSIFGV
jgi:hypothetical protein